MFYVAMTRARVELTITYCRARTVRGKDQKCEPSRFLAEIPAELLQEEATPTREEENLEMLHQLRAKLKQTGG